MMVRQASARVISTGIRVGALSLIFTGKLSARRKPSALIFTGVCLTSTGPGQMVVRIY
jgi:hypothetical protein